MPGATESRRFVVPKDKDLPPEIAELEADGWTYASSSGYKQADGSVVIWMQPPAASKEDDPK